MKVIKVIPCLDIREGRVVKGIKFIDLKDGSIYKSSFDTGIPLRNIQDRKYYG